mmetsp:Transcript_7094/g.21367  ORF Transcript_7094/g.21367 Transcript_7094/m.21367 type:complete len:708 (-) Transcript_7094:286-2409(-)
MFARPEGAADCTAFDAGTLTWLLLVGMIPIWATIGAVCEFVRKRYQLARHGRSVAGQVRAALLSVEYDDLIEADTMAIPAVAAAVRKLRRLMIAAATFAGLLVIPWLPGLFELKEFWPYARAQTDATSPERLQPLFSSSLRTAVSNLRRTRRYQILFVVWACVPMWRLPSEVSAPMLSCEAALLYNVLAALGRYGEGRFGNGVLYDGSDPPVLQYNAAALIGLWLNVGQCIITALMQLMLRLSIHTIDPSASLPAFGHKAARKLRVMASVISAGDGVYSEPVAAETSSRRRPADNLLPVAIVFVLACCEALLLAVPVVYCEAFYRGQPDHVDFSPVWDDVSDAGAMPLLQAMIALQLSTTLATVSVMVFLCYRWREGELGLLGLVEANDGLDEFTSSKFAGSARSLVSGAPTDAARGIFELIGHEEGATRAAMARGTAAIVDEVETHGSETDLECLTYVLDCVAGSSDVTFQHGWSRDAAPSHGGKRLADFVAHPRSRGAGLLEAHVVAQRLYTTAAFRSINTPLRNLATHPVTKEVVLPPKIVEPHPMPCTVAFLYDALKRMRAVAELEEGESHRTSHKAEVEAGSEAGQSVAVTVEVEADSEGEAHGEAVLPEKRGIDTPPGGSGAASTVPADDAAAEVAAAASCGGAGKGLESAGRVKAFCHQMRQLVPHTPVADWLGRAFAKSLSDKEPKVRRLLGPVSPNLG